MPIFEDTRWANNNMPAEDLRDGRCWSGYTMCVSAVQERNMFVSREISSCYFLLSALPQAMQLTAEGSTLPLSLFRFVRQARDIQTGS